nr:MAG TPA: hypothetical protein [Caudoviricetes sp.]
MYTSTVRCCWGLWKSSRWEATPNSHASWGSPTLGRSSSRSYGTAS